MVKAPVARPHGVLHSGVETTPQTNTEEIMNIRALLPFAALAIAPCVFAADVAANWENHCVSCHGADGKGETKMGKKLKIRDLTDAAYQAKFTDADIVKAIKEGVKSETGKTTMKPIEGLTDDEINALVAHVRTLKK
ncbi:MAG: cytochrome C [Opitutus sp.]|nr:cytochrome C [Opitutus sp.]